LTRPVLVEPQTLGGIPCLHVHPAQLTGPAPLVLLYHGWSSKKENQVVAAESLACDGYRVIAPDALHHGERDALPDYDSVQAMVRFWDVVIQTVEEAQGIKQEAVALGLADPDRIGCAGHSMGGMVTAGVLARYPWVRADVTFNGNPCYEWLNGFFHQQQHAPGPSAEEQARLERYNPERLITRMAPRPLLLLHGDADPVVPIVGDRRFMEAARTHYAEHPERLQMEEVPGLVHVVTVGMVESMREWFRWYLPLS